MVSSGTIRAVNPFQLALLSGITKVPRFSSSPVPPVIRPHLLTTQLRGCGCANCGSTLGYIPPDYGTLRGLGDLGQTGVPSSGTGNISILNTIGSGGTFIPGIGTISPQTTSTLGNALKQFESWLGIGAGRNEADIIVPVQNAVTAQLGTVTQQILTGMSPSIATLQNLYRQVWTLGVGFMEFVLQRAFTDRRASGQALNTIMPYIDGSCGYPVPIGPTAYPGTQGCMSWGSGTLGENGNNGMMGAIGRAISNAGGVVPLFTSVEVAANQGIPPTSATVTTSSGGIMTGSIGTLPTTIMGMPSSTFLMMAAVALIIYQYR